MADQTGINSVTTLVVELPGPPVEEVLRTKFTGRWTPRTFAAACRISMKPQTVKVPAHLMRQIWALTGGWKEGAWKPGWEHLVPDPQWRSISLANGELSLVLNDSHAAIEYRGKKLASIYNYQSWLSLDALRRAGNSLGRAYQA